MKYPKQIFASNNKDEVVRKKSSSGGVFYELASYVIKKGGVVVGAAYNGTVVNHVIVDCTEDLWRLQKSKYAPSSVADLKKNIWTLEKYSMALVSGTPCQVKGLRKLLLSMRNNKLLEKIIWVEIACHGVPTIQSYNDFITRNNIIQIDFRDKRKGWRNAEIRMVHGDGSVDFEPLSKNEFYQSYLQGSNLREACLVCKSKYFTSGADLTLADFWGVEAYAKALDDGKGTSLILVHTHKGLSVWKKVCDKFDICKVSLIQAVKWNPCILRPLESSLSEIEKRYVMREKIVNWFYLRLKRLFG